MSKLLNREQFIRAINKGCKDNPESLPTTLAELMPTLDWFCYDHYWDPEKNGERFIYSGGVHLITSDIHSGDWFGYLLLCYTGMIGEGMDNIYKGTDKPYVFLPHEFNVPNIDKFAALCEAFRTGNLEGMGITPSVDLPDRFCTPDRINGVHPKAALHPQPADQPYSTAYDKTSTHDLAAWKDYICYLNKVTNIDYSFNKHIR